MGRLAVVVLLAAAWVGALAAGETGDVPPGLELAVVGLAVLAALTLGELLGRVGVPRLASYLLVGLGVGPALGNAVDASLVGTLQPLQGTAIALVALYAGFLIDPRHLRGARGSVSGLTLATAVGSAAGAALAGYLVASLVGASLFPLEAGSLAALGAALALASSPTTLAAVVQEGGSRGTNTSIALAVTLGRNLLVLPAVAAVLLLVLYGARGASSPAAIVGALLLSLTAAGILATVLLFVGRWLPRLTILPLVVLVGLAYPALKELGGEPVLAFLAAGAVVRWLAGEDEQSPLDEAFRGLAPVATVLLFLLLGTSLSRPLQPGPAVAGVALALGRAVGLWAGTRVGARWLGEQAELPNGGWMLLLPRGALTLSVLTLVGDTFGAAAGPFASMLLATLAVELVAGALGSRVVLRRASELQPGPETPAEEVVESPLHEDEEELPAVTEDRPDPLDQLAEPTSRSVRRAWLNTRRHLIELRRRVREDAIDARLEPVAQLVRVAVRQARQSIQVASEACSRCEDDDAMRRTLREHRHQLARQIRAELEAQPPPAHARRASPEGRGTPEEGETVPSPIELVLDEVERIVRAAPAELQAPEEERHLTPLADDAYLVRIGKRLKRVYRGVQRFLGRPAPTRTIPYRRVVRRAVAGELVAALAPVESLVGRAEFQALRRLENLLRSADRVFQDAMERVDEGVEPEALKEWMHEQLGELREAREDAQNDLVRLGEEPTQRFGEEAMQSLRRVAQLSELADTFELRERQLRYAAMGPRVRAASKEATGERERWASQERALLHRSVLWARLYEFKIAIREDALVPALGPAQRMHMRVEQLLESARNRVATSRKQLLEARDDPERDVAGKGREAGQGAESITEHVDRLVSELRRRVARPTEEILLKLRAGGVVDRLVSALNDVTGRLPREMLLLSERDILALERGSSPARRHPARVRVQSLARNFFDQRVAVRLAEHMHALENSTEEALAGVREAIQLLTMQRARERDPEAPAGGDPGTEQTREELVLGALEAVNERIHREITRTTETADALGHELRDTENRAIDDLWNRLQEETSHPHRAEAEQGLRRRLARSVGRLGQSPRILRLRNLWTRAGERLQRTRRALEGERSDEPAPGGLASIGRSVARLSPDRPDIPYVYGKLFSLEPTENDAFLIDRDEELQLVREQLGSSGGGTFALVGPRGSGRTSVLRIALDDTRTSRPIIHLETDRAFGTPARLVQWISRAAGSRVGESEPETVAASLRQRAPIIVLDGLERVLERSAGGLEAFETLTGLLAGTAGSVRWIVTCEERTWRLMGEIGTLPDLFGTVVRLRRLDPAGIQEAVKRRHRLSGIQLDYRDPISLDPRHWFWWLRRLSAERRYFRRLAEASRGNPRTALQLWLLSLQRDTDRHFEVRPFPRPAPDALQKLPRYLVPALALAYQHSVLDRMHLARAAGWSAVEARAALTSLVSAGLLTSRPRSDGELTWVVPPWAEAAVARHLVARELFARKEEP